MAGEVAAVACFVEFVLVLMGHVEWGAWRWMVECVLRAKDTQVSYADGYRTLLFYLLRFTEHALLPGYFSHTAI